MNIGNWAEFIGIFRKFIEGTPDQIGFLSGFNMLLRTLFEIRIFGVSIILWSVFIFFGGMFLRAVFKGRD